MSLSNIAKVGLLIAVSLLSACASISVSDMYKANFGRQAFPHFDASIDPDPLAITQGLYAPRPLRSSQSQSSWSP
jgi:hypothetical protein